MTDTTPLTPDQLAALREQLRRVREPAFRYTTVGVVDLAALLDMAEQGQRASDAVERVREEWCAIDTAKLLTAARALVADWDRRGSWTPDEPVGMVMRLADIVEKQQVAIAALNGDPR